MRKKEKRRRKLKKKKGERLVEKEREYVFISHTRKL